MELEIPGVTTIADSVITSIVGTVAREIEGVYALGASSIRRTVTERLGRAEARTRGVGMQVGPKEATIDLDLRLIYGFNIPEVATKVRQNIANKLLKLCDLVTEEVNIKVVGLEFPKRMEKQGSRISGYLVGGNVE
jgi:uncharacterized alkaline shock family protein YloU